MVRGKADVLLLCGDLTDHGLPEEAELVAREATRCLHIPIIAVTSYALAGDENKALAAGCDGYVSKPYSPRDLLAKVRAYLA